MMDFEWVKMKGIRLDDTYMPIIFSIKLGNGLFRHVGVWFF